MNLGLFAIIIQIFNKPFWKKIKQGFISKEELTKKYKINWKILEKSENNLK